MNEYYLGLDIGGTNLRVALIQIRNKAPVIVKQENLLTKDVKDIKPILQSHRKVKAACIGFAGPIIGSKAKLTNADLSIDLKELRKIVKDTSVINDFHAIGYGVKYLKEKDTLVLNNGKGFSNDIQMVVGPGTGLGKAYIIEGKVYPCEGGLTTLAIEDIQDFALLDYLKDKYNSGIYYEDVVSGRGLMDIYDHLEIKSNMKINFRIRKLIQEEPVNKAKLITAYSSKDRLCDMTLRIYTKFYARFVRDSALNLISSKVYLVGGISNAISPYLEKYFVEEFLRHRRYSALLKKVNVSVILKENVGLLGCGAVAAKLN